MKFNDKYRDTKPGEFSYDGYYLRGDGGRCEECGCPCDFIEINYEAYFCSEECERAFESRIPDDIDHCPFEGIDIVCDDGALGFDGSVKQCPTAIFNKCQKGF